MIEDVILALDKVFDDIYFDLEEIIHGDKTKIWCIYVSDLDFYLKDSKFKKWKTILKKKYPKVRWYCCYQSGRF